MKQIILAIISIYFLTLNINAQDIARNNIYIEGLGAAGLYSVNYERLLSNDKDVNYPLRIGISLFPQDGSDSGIPELSIPIGISRIQKIGEYDNFIEMGFSTSIAYFKEMERISESRAYEFIYNSYIIPSINIGFSHRPMSGGFNYHIQFLLMYNTSETSNPIMPWIGFGIGKTF